jgi:hypothetical protein
MYRSIVGLILKTIILDTYYENLKQKYSIKKELSANMRWEI